MHATRSHERRSSTTAPPPLDEDADDDLIWVCGSSRAAAACFAIGDDATAPRCSCCEVVLHLPRFDADLGMRTRHALRRQLEVDLERSDVRCGDRRIVDASELLRITAWPRLCTQAVLAPVLEWFLYAGWLVYEMPRTLCGDDARTMRVRISDGGDVSVHKELCVQPMPMSPSPCDGSASTAAPERPPERVSIAVASDGRHQSLIVTVTRS